MKDSLDVKFLNMANFQVLELFKSNGTNFLWN